MNDLKYSLTAKIIIFLLLFPVGLTCLGAFLLLVFHYSSGGNNIFFPILGVIDDTLVNYSLIILPISFIVAASLFGFLLASAGMEKGKESIILNGVDRIYSDLYLLLAGVLIFLGLILSWNTRSFYDTFYFYVLIIILLLFYLYTVFIVSMITLTKRLRTQTLLNNSLLYHLFRHISEVFLHFNVVYQSAIGVIIFGIINGVLLLNIRDDIVKIFFFLFNIFIFGLVIYISLQFNKLKKGIFAISNGDVETKIDSSKLVLGFKEQAEALNEISQGLQKALNEKMRDERFKTELITNVSHDIRTPLTSIVNFVDLMKKEDISNEKACEYLNVLDKNTQRLKELIDDLMEASKASTGNIAVNKEKIIVNELVKQITGEYDETLSEKALKVILDLPETKVCIEADSRHMWRIMENLMTNIKKYTMPNTRVYIDLKANESEMSLSVKNISDEKLNITTEELMERFVRGDKARHTEGSGLGLYIAKNLTELQGGSFELFITGDLFEARIKFLIHNFNNYETHVCQEHTDR